MNNQNKNISYPREINIMTSCDNNLSKYILPQIAAIGENLYNYNINFYLFHSRICIENVKLIHEYTKIFPNINFSVVNIEDKLFYEELARHGGKWPSEAYYWFLAHLYLPNSIERILYIDAGDVIINGDISDYYFKNFNNHSLIVTTEQLIIRNEVPDIFSKDDLNDIENVKKIMSLGIFNSGSFVLNVSKLRGNGITKKEYLDALKMLKSIFNESEELYLGDQGLASFVFIEDMEYYGYSKKINSWYRPYNFGLAFFKEQKNLWYSPIIYHYNARDYKPWYKRFSPEDKTKYNNLLNMENAYAPFHFENNCEQQIDMLEIWWKYCKMTPIYKETSIRAKKFAHKLLMVYKTNHDVK